MRPLVSWMTRVDYVILEWLPDKSIAAPPKVIYDNTKAHAELSHTQVKRRCLRLNDTGLIFRDEARGDGYAISDFGEAYIRGDVSKDLLEAAGDFADSGDGFEEMGDINLETVREVLEDEGFLPLED